MNTITTRRSFLKAAPAAAAVVAIPSAAAASITSKALSPGWERVKADYAAACEQVETARKVHDRMEHEQIAFRKTMPTRGVVLTPNGAQMTDPAAEPSVKLTARNYDQDLFRGLLKNQPEYAAYCEEAKAWLAKEQAHAKARGWDAIEAEWLDAVDAQDDAWRALVAFPVHTAEEAAEKLAISRELATDDASADRLLDGITADLTRITAA